MASQGAHRPAPAVQPATLANSPVVRLRYLSQSRISLRGPASGKMYELSGTGEDVLVDARDAAAFEQSGLFQRPGE